MLKLEHDLCPQVRMQFMTLLSRLTSSISSIQKTAHFALKYGSRYGDDLWDCLQDEVSKASLNHAINLLYFIEALLVDTTGTQPYPALARRDLAKIVEHVVPRTREGVLNLMSTEQVRPPSRCVHSCTSDARCRRF